jgi:hypothetical protein
MDRELTHQSEESEQPLHIDVPLRAIIERLRGGPPLSSDDNDIFEYAAQQLASRRSDNNPSRRAES